MDRYEWEWEGDNVAIDKDCLTYTDWGAGGDLVECCADCITPHLVAELLRLAEENERLRQEVRT